jgi:mono/diheme cytochrome c family protein
VPDSLPKGVTADMIQQGNKLFHGAGICSTCHGPDAKGLPGLGVNLTDKEWLHSDGSYEAIVKQIMTGVPAGQSKSGIVMPPKGGSAMTDDQVRAVAAYVWSLSHQKK